MADDTSYLERLRTEHSPAGRCGICGNWAPVLERHHELYRPERIIFICHKCHHKTHFLPWQLTDTAKEKLLRTRHGFGKTITDEMKEEYVAPGRRPVQLEVRRNASNRRKAGSAVR